MASAAAAVLATAAPASASTIHPNTSWIGTCSVFRGVTSAGGWCDGNGPNWVYQSRVYCANGVDFTGIAHWAGDRRGSTATCMGSNAVRGGVDVYFNGIYEFSRYS